MSRYLHQIRFEKVHSFNRPVMEVSARNLPSVVMGATPFVQEKLGRYLVGSTEDKYLSPSALNTYLDCRLKFYFRYLARLGETDEVAEDIGSMGFGTVVHESLRILYESIADPDTGTITKQGLDKLRKDDHMDRVIREVFRREHFGNRRNAVLEGRNLLIVRVMRRYMDKVIAVDMEAAPFQLLSVEKDFHREMAFRSGDRQLKVHLGGKIDRIDLVNKRVRVIDYKSGSPPQVFPDVDSLFDSSRRNRAGAAFQTLYYAWLVAPIYQGSSLMPGLYAMKAMFNKNYEPGLRMGEGRSKQIVYSFDEVKDVFENQLEQLLTRLFDPEQTFGQTEDQNTCRSCDFATLCSR
jgi:CRISPR/Cas system-associated exonuclease Cas4 (RecB family)